MLKSTKISEKGTKIVRNSHWESPKNRRKHYPQSLLMMVLAVCFLTGANIFPNTKLLNPESTSSYYYLITLIALFFLTHIYLLLDYLQRFKTKNWLNTVILVIGVASHHELIIGPVLEDPSETMEYLWEFPKQFYPLVLPLIYCLYIARRIHHLRLLFTFLCCGYISFRKNYIHAKQTSMVFTSILNLVCVLGLLWMFIPEMFKPKVHSSDDLKTIEAAEHDIEARVPSKEIYKTMETHQEPLKKKQVSFEETKIKSTKMRSLIGRGLSEIAFNDLSPRSHNHFTVAESEGQISADESMFKVSGEPEFEYDYCYTMPLHTHSIIRDIKHTYTKENIKLCQFLKDKIENNLEIIKIVSSSGKPIAKTDLEEGADKKMSAKWSYDVDATPRLNGRSKRHYLKYKSQHSTLNEVLADLKKELGQSDEPFDFLPSTSFKELKAGVDIEKELFKGPDKSYSPKAESPPSNKDFNTLATPRGNKRLSKEELSRHYEFKLTVSVDYDPKVDGEKNFNKNDKEGDEPRTCLFDIRIQPVSRMEPTKLEDKTPHEKKWYLNIFVLCKKSVQQTNKSTDLLNYISHEMRAPVVAVLGCMNHFLSKAANEPFSKEKAFENLTNVYLKQAELHIKNLLEACQLILEMSRSGDEEIKGTEFNLKKLIKDTIRIFDFDLSKNTKKKLVVDYFGDVKAHDPSGASAPHTHKKSTNFFTGMFKSRSVGFIRSDPIRIKQIIINLISNALKYTPKGTVTLKIEEMSEQHPLLKLLPGINKMKQIKISVIDSGIGIEEKNLNNLFKAFGRVQNKEDQMLNSKGVGLGLLLSNKMCKQISKLNRPKGIEVKSKYGEGATFSFFVDNLFSNEYEMQLMNGSIKDEKGQKQIYCHIDKDNICLKSKTNLMNLQAEMMLMKTFLKSTRVMLVDDSELNLELIKDMIENLGSQVSTFANPVDALEDVTLKYKEKKPLYNIYILDFEMPILNGSQLAQKIRNLGGELASAPILVASANHMEPQEVLDKGFSDQISKPVSMNELMSMLKKFLSLNSDVFNPLVKSQASPGGHPVSDTSDNTVKKHTLIDQPVFPEDKNKSAQLDEGKSSRHTPEDYCFESLPSKLTTNNAVGSPRLDRES